ncbi:hypothetical protein SRIMM317S_06197 [Streptomyces rimosus subsp. rimosus]
MDELKASTARVWASPFRAGMALVEPPGPRSA